jgi:hypothetical protein
MKSRYFNLALLSVALTSALLTPAARGDELDKKTIIKIDSPVQIQDAVLASGEHVLKLLNTSGSRTTVLVFNADETKLETIILANNASRLQATSRTELMFYETSAGSTPALHTWFYPGDTTGLEFLAPKQAAGAAANLGSQKPHDTAHD